METIRRKRSPSEGADTQSQHGDTDDAEKPYRTRSSTPTPIRGSSTTKLVILLIFATPLAYYASKSASISSFVHPKGSIHVTRNADESYGLTFDSDFRLTKVDPYSPGMEAGMTSYVGKSLTHVNGVKVVFKEELVRALKTFTDMSLTFSNEGFQKQAAPTDPGQQSTRRTFVLGQQVRFVKEVNAKGKPVPVGSLGIVMSIPDAGLVVAEVEVLGVRYDALESDVEGLDDAPEPTLPQTDEGQGIFQTISVSGNGVMYTFTHDEAQFNDQPMWVDANGRVLYTSQSGKWMIGKDSNSAKGNRGTIRSKDAHKGMLPNELDQWEMMKQKQWISVPLSFSGSGARTPLVKRPNPVPQAPVRTDPPTPPRSPPVKKEEPKAEPKPTVPPPPPRTEASPTKTDAPPQPVVTDTPSQRAEEMPAEEMKEMKEAAKTDDASTDAMVKDPGVKEEMEGSEVKEMDGSMKDTADPEPKEAMEAMEEVSEVTEKPKPKPKPKPAKTRVPKTQAPDTIAPTAVPTMKPIARTPAPTRPTRVPTPMPTSAPPIKPSVTGCSGDAPAPRMFIQWKDTSSVFELVEKQWNKMPKWRDQKGNFLFSSGGGAWMIGNEDGPAQNRGIFKSNAHKTKMPHTMTEWTELTSKGDWMPSAMEILCSTTYPISEPHTPGSKKKPVYLVFTSPNFAATYNLVHAVWQGRPMWEDAIKRKLFASNGGYWLVGDNTKNEGFLKTTTSSQRKQPHEVEKWEIRNPTGKYEKIDLKIQAFDKLGWHEEVSTFLDTTKPTEFRYVSLFENNKINHAKITGSYRSRSSVSSRGSVPSGHSQVLPKRGFPLRKAYVPPVQE